jgi:hypothetical protein
MILIPIPLKTHATVLIFTLLMIGAVAAQTRQKDRAFDGLRGNVKAVSTVIADAKQSGDVIKESKRRPQQYTEYDLDGNRTSQKDYDYLSGQVRDIIEYKRVNCDRVAMHLTGDRSGMITNRSSPGVIKSNSKDPAVEFTETVKLRYDDAGQVTEESMYQEDGSLWLRYVYNRKGNETEELVYDKSGKLNQKYVSIYDDKGNMTERVFFDTDSGKPESREIYEYIEFDSKGNWTKRLTSEVGPKKNSNRKPRDFHYRKLTYF